MTTEDRSMSAELDATRQALNDQFARVAKAIAHPGRIQLLDLLIEREQPVDALIEASGMARSTTSAHLQVLRRAQLVQTRRDGTQIFYRSAGAHVTELLHSLRQVAAAQLAEIDQITKDYFEARDGLEPVQRADLLARVERGEVVVIDVRTAAEFGAAHIPGAVSIPLDELADRVDELPEDREMVAYCRGSYCVLSADAVAVLRDSGRRARRLDGGMPEWQLDGHPAAP